MVVRAARVAVTWRYWALATRVPSVARFELPEAAGQFARQGSLRGRAEPVEDRLGVVNVGAARVRVRGSRASPGVPYFLR